MARDHALGGGDGELRLAQQLVGPQDLAELLPDGGHQVFLPLLHDLRPEPGGDAVAGVEVQLVQPARSRAPSELDLGRPRCHRP